LRRGENLRDDQVEGLKTADGETRRMRHLLDDLLDLSRGDSGRLALTNTPVALEPLLLEVIELAGSDQQRQLLLDLPAKAASATALADADRLKQVLLNLLENACKYSPESSPVRLSLRAAPAGWQLQVLDEGIGVPPAERVRIFERFQRGSNAPPGGGSGLGLSVVKLLVEAMGGTICVTDASSGGSCFIVELSSTDSP
jgi:signal transduction histidine kinase